MAQSITNAFVTLFDAEVKQAFQAESVLRGAVRLRLVYLERRINFQNEVKDLLLLEYLNLM
jgi:hypothetical protein